MPWVNADMTSMETAEGGSLGQTLWVRADAGSHMTLRATGHWGPGVSSCASLRFRTEKSTPRMLLVQHTHGNCPMHVIAIVPHAECMEENFLFHWEFSLPWMCGQSMTSKEGIY